MSEEPLGDEVRNLVLHHIDSVVRLEALLFLRASPGEIWEPGMIASRLYARESEMEAALARLCEDGFLRREGNGYRYLARPEYQARIDRLADAYALHLIPVTNLIHGKPGHARTSSDAFKAGKDR
jgi:hypothetical protein